MEIDLLKQNISTRHFPVNWHYDPEGYNGRPCLRGTPGLSLMGSTLPNKGVRGCHIFENKLFWVVGARMYRTDLTGLAQTPTYVSSGVDLDTASSPVSICSNGTHMMVVDGVSGYYVAATDLNTVVKISDTDFTSTPKACAFFFSRFMVATGDGVQWGETVNSPVGWVDAGSNNFNNLDLKSTSSTMLLEDHNELLVIGEERIRFFYGDATSVIIERQAGAMEEGCIAPFSAAKVDSTVYWLAEDYTVRKIVEYVPTVVSKPELTERFVGYTRVDDALGFGFKFEGIPYYALSFPQQGESWLYNVLSDQWTQWAYTTSKLRHRASCGVEHKGVVYLGDHSNGRLYLLDRDAYTDNGATILSEKIFDVVRDENARIRCNRLQLDFKTGVGLATGQGSDPTCMVDYSDDGANSFPSTRERILKLGPIGNRKDRVITRRLGAHRQVNFRVRVTDPVERVLYGAQFKGRSHKARSESDARRT